MRFELTGIEKRYTKKGIRFSRLEFRFFLFTQLIAVGNWQTFFSEHHFEKVVVDFDRDNKNAALISVAKTKGIPSITLVHGVINPPFGYYPVIADEIWVWGSYQKKMLKSSGLEVSRIKIVGNPIAHKQDLQKEEHEITTFGIALNPIGEAINKTFLDTVFVNADLNPHFRWIIKLHPSMQKEEYMKAYESEVVELKAFHEIDNRNFFESIDALILGNSGIGYEALINDIPLLICRTSAESRAHDYIMIKHGTCPDIKDSKTYRQLLKEILTSKDRLKALLEEEQRFLNQEYYYAIGDEAEKNIIQALETVCVD